MKSANYLLVLAAYLLPFSCCLPGWGLPPLEDKPEEVLRTEIITTARSPIDGKLLTAAEYVQLQEQLQTETFAPELSPKIRELIFLLRVRKVLRPVLPFIK